ncbi:winged helix DNA-binding domain-containing protein [Cohnella sp. REN36]|uniref:winged helix DNA-binding domain-containing protein n=1 Tax=Cohnella sp. REN36 TaxID=2887347 RepID=UPI001D153A56|nr:winged helix DNA-binding domain-containing protein [Cohnella sp. REN36]MCC3373886.1 winged helix DNA-binding domain-containing protein [Cohnella sp. REN36]
MGNDTGLDMESAVREGETLSRRRLNRALLARQHLLRRADMPALEAIEHLVGLQAQAPIPPYFGLWTRLNGFRPEDLGALLLSRQAVRIVLMRGTIHLVSARDCLEMRPLIQPVLDRGLSSLLKGRLAGADPAELAEVGRQLVEERPLTFSELGQALAPRWPDLDPAALGDAIRGLVPLVQVPPRGIWGESGQAMHTSAERWLGKALNRGASLEGLVLRYLRAFGPASVADMQKWSGLTGLKRVVERLRPQLLLFRDERGGELFDVPDAPRPAAETPAPVRFLGEFDNMLLSYEDRTRILPRDYRSRVFTVNGIIRSAFLVDGFVRGLWRTEVKGGAARLVIEPFEELDRADREALAEEGEGLLRFVAPDAATREIAFQAERR